MNTELVAVLNETLDELVDQQEEFRKLIDEYRAYANQAEVSVETLENEKRRCESERKRIVQKSEVLRNYISGLNTQPCALLKKVKRLNEEQNKINQNLSKIDREIASALGIRESTQGQLSTAEQRLGELQKEWKEVSEHIGLVEHRSNAHD